MGTAWDCRTQPWNGCAFRQGQVDCRPAEEIPLKELHGHQSVKLLFLLLLAILPTACAPLPSPTLHVTEEAAQLLTPIPPEGTVFLDQCTYMLSHPPELTTADGMLFQSPDDESVFVFIDARRRTDAERDASLDALATQLSAQWIEPSNLTAFESVEVIDYMGNTLEGLQADFPSGGEQHVRLMVVVRPQTMLGDLLPDDVVYEIVAQAPEEMWSVWGPLFDVIFQTFHPKDCGGV